MNTKTICFRRFTIGLPSLNNGEEKVDADPNKYTEEVFKTLVVLQKEVVVA